MNIGLDCLDFMDLPDFMDFDTYNIGFANVLWDLLVDLKHGMEHGY